MICASVIVCVRENIVDVCGVRTGSVMYVHKRMCVHIARSGEYVGNYAPLHGHAPDGPKRALYS